MSIESIMYAKNRHMFGGMEPQQANLNVTGVRRYLNSDTTGYVTLKISVPEDTIIKNRTGDEQVVCSVAGVVVRRKQTGYPQNEFDGDEVIRVTESCEINEPYIFDDDYPVYYYTAFTYSELGVYNKYVSSNNTAMIDGSDYDVDQIPSYVFGYDLDINDSNPATRVSYPSDVDNSKSGFAHIRWGQTFLPAPCMLKYDGAVYSYLNPDDPDSEESVSDSSFAGNAMMEWPKIYTKRWEENGIYHFRCSDVKIDDDYDCWCNYDVNDNEIDHFYTALYSGRVVNGKLRSMKLGTAISEGTLSEMVNYAMANDVGGNKDWYIQTFVDRCLVKDLIIMMGKSTDIAAVCANNAICDRLKIALGDGYLASGLNGTDSETADDGTTRLKITRGKHDGTTVRDYATRLVHGTSYETISDPDKISKTRYLLMHKPDGGTSTNRTQSGYISKMITYPWGRYPSSVNGSTTTYECEQWRSYNYKSSATTNNIKSNACMSGYPTELRIVEHPIDDKERATLSCKPCVLVD